jgi:hypothetical protein
LLRGTVPTMTDSWGAPAEGSPCSTDDRRRRHPPAPEAHERATKAKNRPRRPPNDPGEKTQNPPICSEFAEWRDPDSNRGHHDFQRTPKTRTKIAICRDSASKQSALDAVGFLGILVALGHGAPARGPMTVPLRSSSTGVKPSFGTASRSERRRTCGSASRVRSGVRLALYDNAASRLPSLVTSPALNRSGRSVQAPVNTGFWGRPQTFYKRETASRPSFAWIEAGRARSWQRKSCRIVA